MAVFVLIPSLMAIGVRFHDTAPRRSPLRLLRAQRGNILVKAVNLHEEIFAHPLTLPVNAFQSFTVSFPLPAARNLPSELNAIDSTDALLLLAVRVCCRTKTVFPGVTSAREDDALPFGSSETRTPDGVCLKLTVRRPATSRMRRRRSWKRILEPRPSKRGSAVM